MHTPSLFPPPSLTHHTHAHVHKHTHTPLDTLDLEPPSLLLDALAPITSTNVVAETERHIGIRVAIRSKSVERAERLMRCRSWLFVVCLLVVVVCCCLLYAWSGVERVVVVVWLCVVLEE